MPSIKYDHLLRPARKYTARYRSLIFPLACNGMTTAAHMKE
jgi:hypothetical protein